jgi:hypothetical protein
MFLRFILTTPLTQPAAIVRLRIPKPSTDDLRPHSGYLGAEADDTMISQENSIVIANER